MGDIEGTAAELGSEIIPVDPPPSAPAPPSHTLFATDDPVEVVERATRVANALKDVLVQQGMIQRIGQGEHVKVEGWQVLGGMLGVVPIVTWTRRVTDPDGWEAKVEARTLDGRIVGAGEAQCDRGENRWRTADEHALRSMAQTRATSKALAAPLRFIVKLAGFDGTPAEEMPDKPAAPPLQRRESPARTRIYEAASGNLTALELLNLLRSVKDASPLQISEQDAMTRLDAAITNLSVDDAAAVLKKIHEAGS